MNIHIEINKSDIIEALARTTGYIGFKTQGEDKDAYTRIALTDADSRLLMRFFDEARELLVYALRRQLADESDQQEAYEISLEVSASFDTSLEQTLASGITSYFVQYMASKWLAITDKTQASEYSAAAQSSLDYISRKIYCKRKPSRPKF